MKPPSVLAETRRELLRPSSLWLIPAVMGFCLLLALFSLSEDAFELYPPAVYLFLPTLMVPLAAHRAARDRERDLATAQATTPLTMADVLLGKLAALSILLVTTLMATTPLLFAAVHRTSTGALQQFSPLLAWGLVVGLLSLVVGLGIGFTVSRRGVSALSAGFGVTIAWFLAAVFHRRIMGWAGSEFEFDVLQALVYASPFTWGIQALAPQAPYLLPGHATHLLTLGLLLGILLVMLGTLITAFQRVGGWRPRSSLRAMGAGILAVGLLAVVAVLAAAEPPKPEVEQHPPVHEAAGEEVHIQAGVVVENAWSMRTPATVHLTFTGRPNATVTLESVTLEGDGFSTEELVVSSSEVVLDNIIPAPEHAPPAVEEFAGTAHIPILVLLVAHRMETQPVLHIAVTVDGDRFALTTQQSASPWEMPLGVSIFAGGGTLGVAAAVAFLVPWRLNRW